MSCPICKSDPADKYRPFCSRRCADIDLGRWMTGHYTIPTEEPPDDEHGATHPAHRTEH